MGGPNFERRGRLDGVVGFRKWQLIDGELCSVHNPLGGAEFYKFTRGTNISKCLCAVSIPHNPPQSHRECGFYASANINALQHWWMIKRFSLNYPLITGAVLCGGVTAAHGRVGVRSEFQIILGLAYLREYQARPNFPWLTPQPLTEIIDRENLAPVAEKYGVPLIPGYEIESWALEFGSTLEDLGKIYMPRFYNKPQEKPRWQ